MENITKEQADIIGEVANICTGTAATALSMIINRSTNITTPLVEVLDKENTLESDNHILVKVPYTSGLDGTNLWRHCYPGRQILDFRLSIQRIARLSRFRMNYVMERISSRSLFD